MTFHWNEHKIDDEILEMLRQDSVKLSFRADAAIFAYRNAIKEMWSRKLTAKIGRKFSVIAVIQFPNGEKQEEIKIEQNAIEVDYYCSPTMTFRKRIKSGGWGKTEYIVNARWAIDALVVTKDK